MKVLVINCGSSSFKYQILDMSDKSLLCSGLVERIGQPVGNLVYKKYENGQEVKKVQKEEPYPNHTEAFKKVLEEVTSTEHGSLKSIEEIVATGHRMVQGGEDYTRACRVDSAVLAGINKLASLAPLHNPACVQGVEVAQNLIPHAPAVVVFDTEFHATMPEVAYRYALPEEFYTKYGVRRYGFHGTSHKYVSRKAAEFLGKPADQVNLITCHLGNGCSITAVRGGKSVDTSMGLTPLAGVIMGTRTGDIDPAIPGYISANAGLTPAEVDNVMNKKSGLLALCGMNDMRDIHAAREKGDKKAILAFDMFCYSIKKYIGAYWAALGTVDAIVFTAGIGENDNHARAGIICDMDAWGVKIDPELNNKRSGDVRSISAAGTKIPVLVVPTNEELEIAETVVEVLNSK